MVEEKTVRRRSGPVALETVRLEDLDASDTTFQFRFKSNSKRIRESLAAKGQLNPIKLIAGEDSFRIIDGFTRVQEATQLGFPDLSALIYRGMSDRDAKALSYEANVTRRNLTFAEEANAMQMELNAGFTRDDVAVIFGVSRRTVDRHLELPEELREHVDGRKITMAHGKELAGPWERMSSEDAAGTVAWLQLEGRSVSVLRNYLKKQGYVDGRGRKKRQVACITPDRVRIYDVDVSKDTSTASLRWIASELRSAMEQVERLLEKRDQGSHGQGDGFPEKKTNATNCAQG